MIPVKRSTFVYLFYMCGIYGAQRDLFRYQTMKSKHNYVYFLQHLNEKHRLSIRDQHNDQEIWYMHISPLRALAGLLALILLLFVIILFTVAYTPVLDLIPGYPGNKSREMLLQNILRLDSMEKEMQYMQLYCDNVSLIMEGKTPVVRNPAQSGDSLRAIQSERVAPNREDSLLRAQMEGSGPYSLSEHARQRRSSRTGIELLAPVKGVIVTEFNPKENRFGVGITAASNQQVIAVADGTVISSEWTPDNGYVIQLQHNSNLVSIYRNSFQSLRGVGSRVKAGEAIGYTGEGVAGEKSKGLLVFELWYNGTPVDPKGYIAF